MNATSGSNASRVPRRSQATELLPTGALTHPLWLSAAATLVLAAWVLVDRGGWAYYTTPLRVRAYQAAHATLRPSGSVGQWFGVIGWLMMLVPVAYMVRKHFPRLQRFGSMKLWLEVHIFCGLVGPVFVTLHTSFKFNGLISVAYWSMVVVALSGIVGRYLYVRIPKTIRGVELTYDEVVAQGEALRVALTDTGLPREARAALQEFDGSTASSTPFVPGFRRWRLERRLRASGLDRPTVRALAETASERTSLQLRLASLQRTKTLFGLWHVFHLPLVWVMFGIVTLHIALSLYLGYWPRMPW